MPARDHLTTHPLVSSRATQLPALPGLNADSPTRIKNSPKGIPCFSYYGKGLTFPGFAQVTGGVPQVGAVKARGSCQSGMVSDIRAANSQKFHAEAASVGGAAGDRA
jgi:hypothetical protein